MTFPWLRIAVTASLVACSADEHIERATVPAFPQTRARAGVAYFIVEHNRDQHHFELRAFDLQGNLFGELSADLATTMWPGQNNGYQRPTKLRLTVGTEVIEVIYGAEVEANRFSMTIGGITTHIDGNPAFPARSTPSLDSPLSAQSLSILASWRPLLADLSRHSGTVYGQWTGTTLMLNRSANLIATLSCIGGDSTLCRAGPYERPD